MGFELTSIIALEYLSIDESTNFVNVGNHISHIFRLFHSHGSGDFVSGSLRECTCTYSSIKYHWECTTGQTNSGALWQGSSPEN